MTLTLEQTKQAEAKLRRKRSALLDKSRILGGQIGILASTPKSEPYYSAARFDDLTKQYNQVMDEISKLDGQIVDLYCT